MVYLETMHQSFYPLAAFTLSFFLFIYVCAILGQQLFSGALSTCSNDLIIYRETCNEQVIQASAAYSALHIVLLSSIYK